MTRLTLNLAVPVLAAALLSACGGGHDGSADSNDPLTAVPVRASQSSAGLVEYLASLLGLDADGREPVSLDGFAPPQEDHTEPREVEG